MLLLRTRIVPASSRTFLISRTALLRDPYVGWCGRGGSLSGTPLSKFGNLYQCEFSFDSKDYEKQFKNSATTNYSGPISQDSAICFLRQRHYCLLEKTGNDTLFLRQNELLPDAGHYPTNQKQARLSRHR